MLLSALSVFCGVVVGVVVVVAGFGVCVVVFVVVVVDVVDGSCGFFMN